jgi:SAM-dependent methyltransferase
MIQKRIDNSNAKFWSEPCGTTAAMALNLNLFDKNHVEEFDVWYKRFYPYLFKYLDQIDLNRLSVLEIGIGYGTVSRYLSERVKSLTLLDIAPGALDFVKSSANMKEGTEFVCKSILDYSPQEKFDLVVAIGSLHHTGNLEMAIEKAENLLSDEGQLLLMVYYAFQPRRVLMHPVKTSREFFASRKSLGQRKVVFEELNGRMRAKADANKSGDAAPYTAFSSRKLFEGREDVSYFVELNNFHHIPMVSKFIKRDIFLKYLSKYLGCDIYALGRKKAKSITNSPES